MASSNDLGSSYHIVPGTSSSNEVSELLSSLNLPKYIGMFIANDIDNISTLNEMDDKHFRMLGVSLGHQLNILKHIRSGSGSFVQCPVGSPPIVNQGRDVNNSEVHSAGVPVLTIFSAPRNSDRESPVPTDESRADVIDKRVGADETIYANLVPFERAATAQSHRSFAANSSSDSHRSDAIDVVNRPVNLERAEKQAAARPRLQENERSVQKQAAPGCKLAAFRSNFDDSSPSVQQDAVKKSRSVLAHAAPAAVKISVNAHLKAFKAAFTRTLKLIAVELGSLHPVGDCEKVITRVVSQIDVTFGIQLTDVSTVYNYCESAICNLHIIIYRSIIDNGVAALRGLDELPDNVNEFTTLQYRAVVKQAVTNSYTPIMNAAYLSTGVGAVQIGMGAKQMTHACVHASMPWMFSMARNAARFSQNTARAALTNLDPKHRMEEAARALLSAEPLPQCFTAESIRQLLQRTVALAFQPWRTLTK